MLKRTLLSLVTVFILLQFIPVDRSNPAVEKDFQAPDQVKIVFRYSCYDCHSNETQWPFYSRIAPISWLLAHHVQEGRDHLNFSYYERMDIASKRSAALEIKKELEKGSMPLPLYVRMHPQAKLTPEKRQTVMDWLDVQLKENLQEGN